MDKSGSRISILLPDLRGGGFERIRLVLAHEFQRCRLEVDISLPKIRCYCVHEVSEGEKSCAVVTSAIS